MNVRRKLHSAMTSTQENHSKFIGVQTCSPANSPLFAKISQYSLAPLAGLLILPAIAIAQNSTTDDKKMGMLEEVVVTAQRREQRLQDVPLTLTAVSSDQLEKAGVTNIFDLQSVVSGLSFGGVGNLTQPAIRGLSTGVSTNGSENPNALYIDDVYFAQGNVLGANLPDVQRVEVLKGPQGTLFGRNSVGGAIRVFTKDPTTEELTGDVTVDAGYYTGAGDTQSSPHTAVRGFVSVPFSDSVAMSLSGGYDYTDGYMTNEANGDNYGTISRANARAKLLIEPSDSFRAVFSAFHMKHNDEGLQSATPYKGQVVATLFPDSIVPTTPYHSAFDYGLGLQYNDALVETDSASAKLEFDFEAGTLTSITAWSDTEVFNETTFTHSQALTCAASFVCIDYYYFATNEAVSQEFNFSSEQMGIFSYTAGLFYYNQDSSTDAKVQETFVPGGIPAKTVEFNIESYAAYGEVQIEPTDEWTVILGARYTREPHDDKLVIPSTIEVEETFTSFIPRLTVQYQLSESANVYATYSEGEKSGLSGVDNPGAVAGQLEKIDPEENAAVEIGYKYASANATFNVAGFYYDYKNKQEQGFTGETVFVQNTGPVRIYGIDADTNIQLSDAWNFHSAFTWVPEAEYRDFPDAAGYSTNLVGVRYQLADDYPDDPAINGFDATGYRLVKAPELTANMGMDYEKSTSNGVLDFGFNFFYSSKVYHDIYHVIEQPAYWTVNARAGYTFEDMGLRVGIYGRNLTNEDYIAHGFPSGLGFTAAYARPQELGLTLNYNF